MGCRGARDLTHAVHTEWRWARTACSAAKGSPKGSPHARPSHRDQAKGPEHSRRCRCPADSPWGCTARCTCTRTTPSSRASYTASNSTTLKTVTSRRRQVPREDRARHPASLSRCAPERDDHLRDYGTIFVCAIVGAGVTGAGAVAVGGVVGVVVVAATGVPVTAFRCTLPMVWRAARVALPFTTASAFTWTVLGPPAFGVVIPKSFRIAFAPVPYWPMRKLRRREETALASLLASRSAWPSSSHWLCAASEAASAAVCATKTALSSGGVCVTPPRRIGEGMCLSIPAETPVLRVLMVVRLLLFMIGSFVRAPWGGFRAARGGASRSQGEDDGAGDLYLRFSKKLLCEGLGGARASDRRPTSSGSRAARIAPTWAPRLAARRSPRCSTFAGSRISDQGLREERGGLREERGGFREERGGFREERGGFREERGGFREERGGLRRESKG